ncbi:MAG: DUF3445 domain-containing protein [Pseudomonadota bacterium]
MTRRPKLDQALYTPFMDRRTAHPPGISPLDPADWFPVDPDFAEQMAYRAELIDRVPEIVLAELSEAAPAVAELWGAVLAHLTAHPGFAVGPDKARRPDGVDVPLRPGLTGLGHLVADDFCVLEKPEGAAEYILTAAVLCFPSRWLLSEKIGQPLTEIHDPVPDYDESLATRVNRLFEAIRPGRPMVRVNWLVHRTAELHLPLGLHDKQGAARDRAEGLYLRTERQTLTRLPETGAVIFGIKTSVCDLEVLTPLQAAALARELSVMDPRSIAYRAGRDLHQAALARLAEIATPVSHR